LARIAHNESLNWLRKYRRETLCDELPEPGFFGIPGQERELLTREIQESLGKGLGSLNPRYRLAVTLRYFEGLSLREIAEIQDCSVGMVKNTLFRGLRQLQAFLLARKIEKTAMSAYRRGIS
jgi:RNA polymerase sigma-70 factor (ECF subfamily)